MTELVRDRLRVIVQPDRPTLGVAAAAYSADRLRTLLEHQQRVRVIFAAAASQNEVLAALG